MYFDFVREILWMLDPAQGFALRARRGGNILFADATPTGGEASAYIRSRIAPPLCAGVLRKRGEAFEDICCRIAFPLFLRVWCGR